MNSAQRVAAGRYQPIDRPDSFITAYENYRYWCMEHAKKHAVPAGKLQEAIRYLQQYPKPDEETHRGTTITDLEEIVDTVIRCGSCRDVTNNAEPFCNGPICFKRGD